MKGHRGSAIFISANITARGSNTAGRVTGLREMPVEDITFSDVHIQSKTGMTVTSAKNIVFKDVTIDTDAGPAVTLKGSSEIDTARLKTLRPHEGIPLVVGK